MTFQPSTALWPHDLQGVTESILDSTKGVHCVSGGETIVAIKIPYSGLGESIKSGSPNAGSTSRERSWLGLHGTHVLPHQSWDFLYWLGL